MKLQFSERKIGQLPETMKSRSLLSERGAPKCDNQDHAKNLGHLSTEFSSQPLFDYMTNAC